MHDHGGFVRAEDSIESAAIPNVADLERAPFDELGVPIREVVIYDRYEALIE
jgi:hypothetical protein